MDAITIFADRSVRTCLLGAAPDAGSANTEPRGTLIVIGASSTIAIQTNGTQCAIPTRTTTNALATGT